MVNSEEKVLNAVGESIRKFRVNAEMSQEKLADLSGLHRTYIGGVERGERNPSLLSLFKIALALNVTIGEILNEARC